MDENNNGLTVYNQSSGNMLVVTEADKKAAYMLKKQLPYGDKLTDDEALALYSFSVAHDLDPRNGECFFMVRDEYTGKDGKHHPRESLGVYPGIKGKRKKAKDQLRVWSGGAAATYNCKHTSINPQDLGLNPADVLIADKCELRDDVSMGQYLIKVTSLVSAGFSKDEIKGMIGEAPVWVGYGIVKKQEAYYLKQPPLVVAQKRSENSATMQRFDLPFVDAIAEDIDGPAIATGDVIDGDTVVEEVKKQIAASTPEQRKARIRENMAALGFDEPNMDQSEFDDAEFIEFSDPDKGEISPLQIAKETTDSNGQKYNDKTTDQLQAIVDNERAPDEKRKAASLIIDSRIGMGEY